MAALQVETLTSRWERAKRSLTGLFVSHAFSTTVILSIMMRDARVVESLEALARSMGEAMGVPGICSSLKSYSSAQPIRCA